MNKVWPAVDSSFEESLMARALDALTGGTGRANPETLRALDRAMGIALESSKPVGAYALSDVLGFDGRAVSTREGDIHSPMFARLAEKAAGGRLVAVYMLVTAGGTLDEEIRGMDSLLDRYVLDAVGSELAEIVADLVERDWTGELAAGGLEASVRVSPGYCDWVLEGQDVAFAALDAGAIGVRLTPSYLMVPVKSVSSVSLAAESLPLKVPCTVCGREGCPYRRAGRQAPAGAGAAGETPGGMSA